jgi:hypothetical protein
MMARTKERRVACQEYDILRKEGKSIGILAYRNIGRKGRGREPAHNQQLVHVLLLQRLVHAGVEQRLHGARRVVLRSHQNASQGIVTIATAAATTAATNITTTATNASTTTTNTNATTTNATATITTQTCRSTAALFSAHLEQDPAVNDSDAAAADLLEKFDLVDRVLLPVASPAGIKEGRATRRTVSDIRSHVSINIHPIRQAGKKSNLERH